ncbi:cupin domain-containing protein [Lysobacter sp. BMK333-48F3]|uniref:cupin domain-containing protein n=1 Tax=Lysobacter sp. BMK333-48F3 TaxID=2867962 RepID=UPI001C8CD9FA|nr:cupin domain-containing protein [Lysobacter sp. BMK333-48F3]MBX9400878.1 cupin domain-containing protein [Lysobacter sp. BMK333-48F3]
MSDPEKTLSERLIRNVQEVPLERFERGSKYLSDRVRITDGTVARKLAATYDVVPAGMRACPYHLHYAQEEMFIILEGTGTLRVAGEMLPVKAGDVICIPPGPEYPHQLINTSSEALKYLSIGTTDDPEICVYPDSGKFMAEANLGGTAPFEAIDRIDGGVDYWSGES